MRNFELETLIKKTIFVLLLIVLFVVLGVFIVQLNLINHPAYWSLYGALCGGAIVAAVDLR
jgi:hypothetical protein